MPDESTKMHEVLSAGDVETLSRAMAASMKEHLADKYAHCLMLVFSIDPAQGLQMDHAHMWSSFGGNKDQVYYCLHVMQDMVETQNPDPTH